MELGADYVEPDLVSTADGVLVARHERELGGSTDVAAHAEFAARRVSKEIRARRVTGWFTEDFSLAELKTLRARERLPDVRAANTAYDGRCQVPTFDEVLELVARWSRRERPVGVYPETKDPGHFRSIGLALEQPLVESLGRHGFDGPGASVYIQSFDPRSLRTLSAMTRLPLVQLVDRAGVPGPSADITTPAALDDIAVLAQVIGVHKDLVIPRDPAGCLTAPTNLVASAHRAGLRVHAWTFRAENPFLPTDLRIGDPADPGFARRSGNWGAEYAAFYATGIDGVFSDQPELAVAARERMERPG